jgi:hypothetical protein
MKRRMIVRCAAFVCVSNFTSTTIQAIKVYDTANKCIPTVTASILIYPVWQKCLPVRMFGFKERDIHPFTQFGLAVRIPL